MIVNKLKPKRPIHQQLTCPLPKLHYKNKTLLEAKPLSPNNILEKTHKQKTKVEENQNNLGFMEENLSKFSYDLPIDIIDFEDFNEE